MVKVNCVAIIAHGLQKEKKNKTAMFFYSGWSGIIPFACALWKVKDLDYKD